MVSIKGIRINNQHINERLIRATTSNVSKLQAQIARVIAFLSSKRSILSPGVQWEIVTSSFKAVGEGNCWTTVLKRDEHSSRSVVHRWTV